MQPCGNVELTNSYRFLKKAGDALSVIKVMGLMSQKSALVLRSFLTLTCNGPLVCFNPFRLVFSVGSYITGIPFACGLVSCVLGSVQRGRVKFRHREGEIV